MQENRDAGKIPPRKRWRCSLLDTGTMAMRVLISLAFFCTFASLAFSFPFTLNKKTYASAIVSADPFGNNNYYRAGRKHNKIKFTGSASSIPPAWHLELVREELNTNSYGISPRQSTTTADSRRSPPPVSCSSQTSEGKAESGFFARRRRSNDFDHEAIYQRRKDEWAAKYTSFEALCETFGYNQNESWGDLDAQTARRLYKTLLPRSLLELYKFGVKAEDLAPLAYSARKAAKMYAQYRCRVPSRVAAKLYDGFRQWRNYGSFDTKGMSYQQIWEKYSKVILEESDLEEEDMNTEDVTAKICLKILERSCKTNEMIDKLCMTDGILPGFKSDEDLKDLQHITDQLEQDVRQLLLPVTDSEANKKKIPKNKLNQKMHISRFRTLKNIVRITRKLEHSKKDEKAESIPQTNKLELPETDGASGTHNKQT